VAPMSKPSAERPSAMDARLVTALQMIAPGTVLRAAIDNIVRARTGALLVFADEEQIRPMISGGIDIDVALKPMILYELAKMDGAILLDRTGSHIIHANVQLMPDARIDSQETGTRHRTAERVAKQLDALAISISAARDVVTVYTGDIRYIMDPIRVILSKADQALTTLERFRLRLGQVTNLLSVAEFREGATLYDVLNVLQRSEMVLAIVRLIERYVIELGTEGRLVQLQLEELLVNVREDRIAVLADYLPDPVPARLEQARVALEALPSDALLSVATIGEVLGYAFDADSLETHVHPRGYRMLRRIPRLSNHAIEAVVNRFGGLPAILEAGVDELAAVDGVGATRAHHIRDGLARLRERDLLERGG
jgi:diadenylate cyclase